RPGRPGRRPRGGAGAQAGAAHGVRLRAAARVPRRRRRAPPVRHHAPRHGTRRAAPAVRRPGAGERGVHHRRPARAGHHPARHPGLGGRRGRGEHVRLGRRVPPGPLPADQRRGAHPRGGDVPGVCPPVHPRHLRWPPGGIVTYAPESIYEEVAYVAYHFHWPLDDILDLEHAQRLRYVREIAQINRRLSEEGGAVRWPWQRRRPAEPGAAPPAGGAAAAVPPPPLPSGWAFHPPLQRVIAPDMAVHRGGGAGWTTTGRDLGFTGSMTHLVSAASFSGVVDGDGGGLGPTVLRGVPPAVPPADLRGPEDAPVTRPTAGGSLTRAVGAPGVPVYRYAESPGPLPRPTARPGVPAADTSPDLAPVVPSPDVASAPPDTAGSASLGAGWTNPDLELDDGGTVVEIPLPTARAVEAPPVQRAPDPAPDPAPPSGRRLGLGAPLAPPGTSSERAAPSPSPRSPEVGSSAPTAHGVTAQRSAAPDLPVAPHRSGPPDGTAPGEDLLTPEPPAPEPPSPGARTGLPVAAHRHAATDGRLPATVLPGAEPPAAPTWAVPPAQRSASSDLPVTGRGHAETGRTVTPDDASGRRPASEPTSSTPTAQRSASTEGPVAGHRAAETD